MIILNSSENLRIFNYFGKFFEYGLKFSFSPGNTKIQKYSIIILKGQVLTSPEEKRVGWVSEEMRSVRELAWGMWRYKGGGDGIEGEGDNGASCRDWGKPKKSLRLQEPFFVCLLICLSKGSDGKESPCNAGPGFKTWIGKIPWRRAWQPLQYSCLENPHEQRSLVGCSPRGRWGSGVRFKRKDSVSLWKEL